MPRVEPADVVVEGFGARLPEPYVLAMAERRPHPVWINLEYLTAEAWDLIFDVNLKGMWLTCKHVLPVMRQQRSGAIVNISSLAAVASAPMLAYKTSKAGVNLLSRSRIKKRSCSARSPRTINRLRACWVTQPLVGWAVIPARCTRRRPCSTTTRM